MAGATSQPQGSTTLDTSNPLLTGAAAIISATSAKNLVSGVDLTVSGSGVAKITTPSGQADSFRKNFYKATEVLPVVGMQPFVEFWVGYPNSDLGARGNGNETGFIVGSSNNITGIAGNLGQKTTQGGTFSDWGAVTNPSDWSKLSTANDTLVPGEFTVLVVARYSDRMELWRNGVLRRTVTQTSTTIAASKLIVGSFIEDTAYWPSSSDMLIAGRIINNPWSSSQITSFSNNPWQIFEGEAPSGTTATASWTEQSDTTQAQVSAKVNAAAGWSESPESSAAQGTVGSMTIATAAWTEAAESQSAIAALAVRATAGWTEAAETTAIRIIPLTPGMASIGWVEASESTAAQVDVGDESTIQRPETTMQKYSNAYLGPTGIAIKGAVVTVTKADGTPATIYSDNGVTPITSVLTAADGEFSFYAANGRYNFRLRKRGLVDEVVNDVLLYDPAQFGEFTAATDAPVTGYIVVKDTTGASRKLAVIA